MPVRYLAGIVVPGDPAIHPDHQRALNLADAAINQRTSYLIHQAQADETSWTAALGTRP